MLSQICFSRASLHLDIAEIAYVAADVQSDGNNAHRLHSTIDICEAGNLPRINSLLDLAFAEALHTLSPLLSPRPSTTGNAIAEKERNPTDESNVNASDGSNPNETVGNGREATDRSGGMLCVTFRKEAVNPVALLRIRETLHEYLIASVLYGWLSVSLPSAASHWKEVRESLLSALGAIAPLLRAKKRRQSVF